MASKKKAKSKKRPNKNKQTQTLKWVIGFVILLIILFYIRHKSLPAEIPDILEEPEIPVVEPDADLDEPVVDEPEVEKEPIKTGTTMSEEKLQELEDQALAIDVTENTRLIDNVVCSFDEESELKYIRLTLTNVFEETFKISHVGVHKDYNTYFLVRGIVDQDPGCEQEELTPGESTVCTKIGFDSKTYGNIEGINRLSIQVPGKTEALLIECP
ncbi:hypothetical protein HOK51_01505 [Candidatus Woesearchaeota archaeon]|jgi:hypothetical protein|nr:hypothetical protein [Candidatus Woesearchaeota archaeon]MBT6518490.1 hypothetical protein [Candidatus Woesearchaeota archaeon]MBT7367002.1 hypothetical protein [Candidatus Woesearchaeota archaeon]